MQLSVDDINESAVIMGLRQGYLNTDLHNARIIARLDFLEKPKGGEEIFIFLITSTGYIL